MFSACNIRYYFNDLSLPRVIVLGASHEFEPFLELLLNERVNVLCMDRNPALPEKFIERWSGRLVCLAEDFSRMENTIKAVQDYGITHTAALPVGRALTAMGRINDIFGFSGPSFDQVDTMTDKKAFHLFLEQQGLEDYQWMFLDSRSCLDLSPRYDELEEKFGYPFIIKPVGGSGSMGAALLSNRAEMAEYRIPMRFVEGGVSRIST